MKNTSLLLTFFSILLFLPLAHDLGRYGFFGGALWNDNGFLLLLFFFVFFGVQKKYSLNSFGVLLLATLAALIFINVGEHGIFFSHFSAWARYLVFIMLPFFVWQVAGKPKSLQPSPVDFFRQGSGQVAQGYGRRSPKPRNDSNIFSFALLALVFIGITTLQAQWGLVQFIFQHDLGFSFLGEPHFTVDTNGVAKFMMQGTKIIRAYGPYLHPNALAASLLAGLQMCAFSMINLGKQKKSERFGATIYLTFTSFFILLALLLTFSRASLLGFGLLLCTYAFLKLRHSISFFAVLRQITRTLILPFLILLIVMVPFFYNRTIDREDKAINERVSAYVFLGKIVKEASFPTILTGVGIGMYPVYLKSYLLRSNTAFEPWEASPFHNSFILLLVEVGVLGALVLGVTLIACLRTQKLNMWYWAWLMLPILPAMLSDHHFSTSTGSFVMWELLALLTYRLSEDDAYRLFVRKKRVIA